MRLNPIHTLILAAMLLVGNLSAQTTTPLGIVAHHGFHKYGDLAENAIASHINAIDHDLYGTELNVQLTADNICVVYHDNKLSGIPIQYAYFTEISDNPASTLSNGERIPQLPDLLEGIAQALQQQQKRHSTTKLFIEIMVDADCSHKISLAINQVLEEIDRHGMAKNSCLLSSNIDVCRQLVKQRPELEVAYLGGDLSPKELSGMGIKGIDYHFKHILAHPEWVKEAHNLGMTVNTWSVNDTDQALELLDLGVDLLTTDRPLEIGDCIHKHNEKIKNHKKDK